jgi:hypothetical protein
MKSTSNSALLGVFMKTSHALVILLVLSGQAVAGAAKAPPSQVCIDSRDFDSSRVRLASFNLSGVGETMLLFCSDANGNIRSLFVPPQFINVHAQENPSNNELTFNSDLFADDRFYSFKGHSSGRDIVGRLELSTKNGSTILKTPVTIKKLRNLLDTTNREPKLMHYSNAEFIQESGDVIGAEIWIVSTGKEMTGFVVFYESYWGEPVQIPLAMKRIGKAGTTITFDLHVPTTRGYKLVLSAKRAKLFRLGEEKPSEAVVLVSSPLLGRFPIR